MPSGSTASVTDWRAVQFIDSVAMMGARLRAKRLASDLDLISSSGSLPVQPAISGLGQFLSLKHQEGRVANDRSQGTADVAHRPPKVAKSPKRSAKDS